MLAGKESKRREIKPAVRVKSIYFFADSIVSKGLDWQCNSACRKVGETERKVGCVTQVSAGNMFQSSGRKIDGHIWFDMSKGS
jgi:hypothetical protein